MSISKIKLTIKLCKTTNKLGMKGRNNMDKNTVLEKSRNSRRDEGIEYA
ncbi:hypothetical protein R2R32_01195 [Clostridium perfringens]|nr:hypothetical protein [Clostridium perfringens]